MTEFSQLTEKVQYVGHLGEIVHTEQSDGRLFELYRRPPGVRLIVVGPRGLLLTTEFRYELGGNDVRLPGGKVFDDAESFSRARSDGSVREAAVAAAKREAREEVGLSVGNLRLVTVARAGATVEWDLYYFQTNAFSVLPDGPALERGEDITFDWYSVEAVTKVARSGRMSEWRSVGVLLALVLPGLEENGTPPNSSSDSL